MGIPGRGRRKAAMEFRFFATFDSQRKADREAHGIEERNDEKARFVGGAAVERLEARHGDGRGDARRGRRSARRTLERLNGGHLRQKDFPVVDFGNNNHCHSMHPGALFTDEKRVLPNNGRDE